MNEFHTTQSIDQISSDIHRDRIAEASARRSAATGTPRVRRARSRLTATLAIGLTVASTGIMAGIASANDTAPATVCSVGTSYEVGCSMISGRPDGWFDPADVASATSGATGNNDAAPRWSSRLR